MERAPGGRGSFWQQTEVSLLPSTLLSSTQNLLPSLFSTRAERLTVCHLQSRDFIICSTHPSLAQTLRSRVCSHSTRSFPPAATLGSCFQSPEDLPATFQAGPDPRIGPLRAPQWGPHRLPGWGRGVAQRAGKPQPRATDRAVSASVRPAPDHHTVSNYRHLQLSAGSFRPPGCLGLDPGWKSVSAPCSCSGSNTHSDRGAPSTRAPWQVRAQATNPFTVPSLSHTLAPQGVLPRIPSQINYLHLDTALREIYLR